MYSPLGGDVESGATGRDYGGGSTSYDKHGHEPAAWAESQVRQGFVRKVFGILAVQLLITIGCMAAFMFAPPVKYFVASNPWTLWASMGLSFVLVITLSCSEKARRSHPMNLIMLLAFTLCEGVLLGAVSVVYDTQIVLLAVGITAAVVTGLALFALQTKLDLTASGGALLSLLFTLLFASLLQSFIHATWLQFAISAGGAALFSCYLVFDLQLLLGGGAVALSPDEYVYASLALYLDVINLLLYILRLLNDISRDN